MFVVWSIYVILKQIFEIVIFQLDNLFKEVGLIEYFCFGFYVICFVMINICGEIRLKVGEEMVSVFLLIIFNLIFGYLFFVFKVEIQIFDMMVEEGVKLVIFVGIVELDYLRIGVSKE